MEEYFPLSPENKNAEEYNKNLPGLGGVFNSRNLQTYHYAGNNPLKYVDPSGRYSYYHQTPEYRALVEQKNLERAIAADGGDADIYFESQRIERIQHLREAQVWVNKYQKVMTVGGGVALWGSVQKFLTTALKKAGALGTAIGVLDYLIGVHGQMLAEEELRLERADKSTLDRENLENSRAKLMELRGLFSIARDTENEIKQLREQRNNTKSSGEQSQLSARIDALERELKQQLEAVENKKREMGLIE